MPHNLLLALSLRSGLDCGDVVHQALQIIMLRETNIKMLRVTAVALVQVSEPVGDQDAPRILLHLHKEEYVVLLVELFVQRSVHLAAVVDVNAIALTLQVAHKFDLLW